MDTQLLRQADSILSKCGRPTPPAGMSVVYIPRSFLIQAVVPVQSTLTYAKEITGDTTWCLRSISSTVSASLALFVQVQLPDGRYLINGLQDVTQIGGYGSYRYLFTKELPCPPGSKLQITLDTSTPAAASSQPIVMLFEGAYAYYLNCKTLDRERLNVEDMASAMPRYLGTTNQNILAPCWMSGEGPRTPEGFQDERYIYSSAVVSFASVTAGQLQQSTQIQIRQDSDFQCRRILVDLIAAETITAGVVLGRVRLSSGYQLTDDFIDLARILGSVPFAKDWRCPAGDAVVFELAVADGAGAGALTVQLHLDGVMRKRVSA